MVGSLMLLKLLHCKYHRKRRSTQNCNPITHQCTSDTSIVKKEVNEFNEIQSTCRICLKEGDIPIYGDSTAEDISETLKTITGVEISIEDEYPKFLCQSCNALLQGAILLRKTAQQSDHALRFKPQDHTLDDDTFQNTDDNSYDDSEDDKIKKRESNYNCKKCDISFDTFDEYSEHRLTEEHENMRQTCPVCKNSYTSVYLKKHMLLHKLDTPYMCDICGKKFSIQGHFSRHRLTHFYSLPFKCTLCPYKGRFRESLKMHMRSHTGEKPYQCTQCPGRFVNKSNLNKHILTHKGDHDFKCESCGRGFYTKRDLELHFKVDHTGIKDHLCNVCGKAFGYRKQMMKHQLKVHKREKLRSGRMPLYLQVESGKGFSEKPEEPE